MQSSEQSDYIPVNFIQVLNANCLFMTIDGPYMTLILIKGAITVLKKSFVLITNLEIKPFIA